MGKEETKSGTAPSLSLLLNNRGVQNPSIAFEEPVGRGWGIWDGSGLGSNLGLRIYASLSFRFPDLKKWEL